MLPVYIGKHDKGITLKEPIDISSPLSEDERKKIFDFLKSFGRGNKSESLISSLSNDTHQIL